MLCLASCVEVVFVGESCVLRVVFTQILSGGSLCGKSCVDELVKILLCEGGDVERVLEPQNISLCLRLIHFLLTLSYLYCVLHHSYCSFILICLVVFVCVPYLGLAKRASYRTSTLIQRNQEEIVQSPSPKIRLHSLVTLSVLH